MNKLKIYVLLGSTRQNRFGEQPAQWIFEKAKKRKELDVEFIDLRDLNLPFFDEPVSPSYNEGKYTVPHAKEWAERIGKADGYIWVSPEYNHSYSAVLKNAIDYVYPEWNKKAVGLVSYGTVGGARAVEHLRGVAAELQMVSMRQSVNIVAPWNLLDDKGQLKTESFDYQGDILLDQLIWWTNALKNARSDDE
ncbi:MAG TPA: NAD(P)H-dependent oxidoreductase [Candidatus Woesebacteria bacterium]|nr:NAD(P)H-dependent oxidoreductase [Candidatus Woesebacteria bacterium]